ncbi:hypothetical protein CDD83_7763 [Cordyceps sp. RAO-2017]|nr:hypothetical protein CDD83_7763 [Cordyceps sp. RAO-2017]
MVVNTRQRLTRLHELELKYRDNIHKTESICRDEEARLLKLQLLSLRDDKAALSETVSDQEAALSALAEENEGLLAELDECREAACARDTLAKKQDKELATLRAELNSLQDAEKVLGKALQEKLALTRELDRLRPEVDQLQSQLANHQATVAETKELRRQLDSLEVELATEQRARQRIQSKDDDAVVAGLRSRLEKAERTLATEAKERERENREHESKLAEAHAVNERLDDRLQTLKAKQKATQAELKETRALLETCRGELDKATRAASRIAAHEPKRRGVAAESGLNRKRRAHEMSYEDMTLQTPGNEDMASKRPPAKKRGVEQAAVGEKSTFSITPFLRRGKDVTDDSLETPAEDAEAGPDSTFAEKEGEQRNAPSQADGEPEPREPGRPSAAEDEAAVPEPKAQAKDSSKPAPRPRGRPRTKGLAAAPPAQVNKLLSKADGVSTKKRAAPALEMVVEAEEQENTTTTTTTTTTTAAARPSRKAAAAEGDGKRKKRKLLGAPASQTLFGGDEDGEAVAGPAPPKPAPTKKLRAQLGGGADKAFAGAAFSPLKRDRRGVNASFLA